MVKYSWQCEPLLYNSGMIREYHLGIRIDDSLKEDLQKLADKDNRSLADYARLVLVAHVKSKREEES